MPFHGSPPGGAPPPPPPAGGGGLPPPPPPPPQWPAQYQPFQPPGAGTFGYPPVQPQQPSSEAIAALVCGIMAFSCFPVGFVAIWLGARARKAAREQPGNAAGDQLALVGMILGAAIGGLGLLFTLFYFGIIAFAVGSSIIKP